MADDYTRRDDTVKEEAAGLGHRVKGGEGRGRFHYW